MRCLVAVSAVEELFLSTLEDPARDDGRTPEREDGRTMPFDPERLGGRGMGLDESSSMLSMLAAERKPLEEVLGGRPLLVGRISLMEGVWPGLEGEVGWAWSWLGRSENQNTST